MEGCRALLEKYMRPDNIEVMFHNPLGPMLCSALTLIPSPELPHAGNLKVL